MWLRVGILLALLGVLQADMGLAAPPSTVAIWRLKSVGVDTPTAERLEVLLRAETGRIAGIQLQAKGLTTAKLAAEDELRRCGGETSCLCKIGKALGVDKLVTGVIGALGNDYTLDLKLVDISSCREERRINEALSGKEDLLIGAIRQALYKLVAPKLFVGSLSVEVPVQGADVRVDGKTVGSTPLSASVGNLRPGVHRLQISKEGLSDFAEEIPIRFQQTTRVRVDLDKSVLTGLSYEKEEPKDETSKTAPVVVAGPVEKETSTVEILAWTSGGLAVASAAMAGILGWRSRVAEQELEEAASAGRPYLNAGHQDTYDRGKTFAMVANIGWGIAGAAAVTSTILFIVEFTGDGAADAPAEGEGTGVEVIPGVGPDGGGLIVRWCF